MILAFAELCFEFEAISPPFTPSHSPANCHQCSVPKVPECFAFRTCCVIIKKGFSAFVMTEYWYRHLTCPLGFPRGDTWYMPIADDDCSLQKVMSPHLLSAPSSHTMVLPCIPLTPIYAIQHSMISLALVASRTTENQIMDTKLYVLSHQL